MKTRLIIITLAIMGVMSCSVKKRHYRSGYHVEWAGKHGKVNKHKETGAGNHITGSYRNAEAEAPPVVKAPPADAPGKPTPPPAKVTPPSMPKPDDDCDILTYRNGEEVKAKIMEVGLHEIKYKKCDNPNGPTYTVKKDEVFMIKYSNGSKDIFKEEPKQPQYTQPNYNNNPYAPPPQAPYQPTPDRSYPGSLVTADIFMAVGGVFILLAEEEGMLILGMLFLGVGVIFSIVGLVVIANNPDKYFGTGSAVLNIVLFVLLLLLVLIVFG
jgi:hypothetical protein